MAAAAADAVQDLAAQLGWWLRPGPRPRHEVRGRDHLLTVRGRDRLGVELTRIERGEEIVDVLGRIVALGH